MELDLDQLSAGELRTKLTFLSKAFERIVQNNGNFVAMLELHRTALPKDLQEETGKYVEAQNKVIATVNEALGFDKNKLN